MTVIAGQGAIFGADHVEWSGGKAVPMIRTAAAKPGALDLIGSARSTKHEFCSKIRALQAYLHARSQDFAGAGPVDWPMISSASSSRCCGGIAGSAIMSNSICAACRPASRTEDRVEVKIGTSSPLRK